MEGHVNLSGHWNIYICKVRGKNYHDCFFPSTTIRVRKNRENKYVKKYSIDTRDRFKGTRAIMNHPLVWLKVPLNYHITLTICVHQVCLFFFFVFWLSLNFSHREFFDMPIFIHKSLSKKFLNLSHIENNNTVARKYTQDVQKQKKTNWTQTDEYY